MNNSKMWEVQQDNNIYISPNLCPKGFDLFLRGVLSKFKEEIELVGQTFYDYHPEEKHGYLGPEDIFTINERAWVGLFNNALLRMDPKAATMQEFGVWTSTSSAGRCDLLFRYNENEKGYDVIAEAKSYTFCNNWDDFDSEKFYFDIVEQGNRYYKTEQNYYQKGVVIMILVFEIINGKDMLDKARKIMKEWHANSDQQTDFLTLYYGEKRGLFLYGKIKVIKEM